MKTRKQKVLSYILAPILGAGVAAGCIVPAILAKPSKWVDEDTIPTVEVDETTKQEGVSIKSTTYVRQNKESTIDLGLPEAKQIGKVEIKIDGRVLSEDDYTIDQETNKITIKASAMKGTNISISVNTEDPIGFEWTEVENAYFASRSIHRNLKSSFKFKVEKGYVVKGTVIAVQVKEGMGYVLDPTDYDISELDAKNMCTVTFKDTTIFKSEGITGISVTAIVEPETGEKVAYINYDNSFELAGIDIDVESYTRYISKDSSTITLPYTLKGTSDVSGTITISNGGEFTKEVEVIFSSQETELNIEFEEGWWDELGEEEYLQLTFENDLKSGTKEQFLEKVDEFLNGDEGFINDPTEFIQDNITIKDSAGQKEYEINNIRYYYNDDPGKVAAVLNFNNEEGIIDLPIGGVDYSKERFEELKSETTSGVIYEIGDKRIRYYDENATKKELKEIIINNLGYVEKIVHESDELNYSISYSKDGPQLPIVTEFTDVHYDFEPKVDDKFNINGLYVVGKINGSDNETLLSPNSLYPYYFIYEGETDITEQVKSGSYTFKTSGEKKYKVVSNSIDPIEQEFTINVKDKIVEKAVKISINRDNFALSGITIVTYAGNISTPYPINVEYSCASTVSGTVKIVNKSGSFSKDLKKTFSSSSISIQFEITEDDWKYINSTDELTFTFEKDPAERKTLTLNPFDTAFKSLNIPLKSYDSKTITNESETTSTVSWELESQALIEMKFNVYFEDSEGYAIQKEVIVPTGSTVFEITFSENDWAEVTSGEQRSVNPYEYISKTANVEINSDFSNYFDSSKQPPQETVTEDDTELEFQAAATQKAKGVVYISPKNDPTNKLKTIDVDLDVGRGQTFTFELDESVWSHLGYGDTIEIHFEESVEPVDTKVIEVPYDDSYGCYNQEDHEIFNWMKAKS